MKIDYGASSIYTEEANNAKEAFTQCIMFESSFRSPKKGGGAWNANEEYTWSWWLAPRKDILFALYNKVSL